MGRKILARGFFGLIGLLVVAYIIDAIQVRVRLATGGPARAYDSVTVLYSSGLKNNKMEIYADQPSAQTCARALFPQLGYSPCWYLRSHTMQSID